jgi:hypothetical protein
MEVRKVLTLEMLVNDPVMYKAFYSNFNDIAGPLTFRGDRTLLGDMSDTYAPEPPCRPAD